MKIIECIMTKNPCYTKGDKITVKGLMLHSVGCPQPCAKVFAQSWNKESYNRACVHAFIDANDGATVQTLPWDYRGWHAGGSANDTHIGIEMCEPNCIKYTSGASFTCSDIAKAKEMVKRTYDAAVELFAYLCEKYNLNPLEDGVIISHKEGGIRGIASGHADPEHLWKGLGMSYTMDTFRDDVKAAMQKKATPTKPAEKIGYTVGMRYLRLGDSGEDVRALQFLLIGRGYCCGLYGANGVFTYSTKQAVLAFQKDAGIAEDGIVGQETMDKLMGVE